MKTVEIKAFPDEIQEEQRLIERAIIKARLSKDSHAILDRKSLDARGKRPFYRLRYHVYESKEYQEPIQFSAEFKDVSKSRPVHIIGAGPAGYFAALECLALGLKPIIIERGKDAQSRRRDLRSIQQFDTVNPDSNYCFGEGGAGTYSDGKLYTRSHKRGSIYKAMKLLVEHGAKQEILYDAHPHIGSNKLPKIIQNIRNSILTHGGEIHFDTKLTDLVVENNRIKQIILNSNQAWDVEQLILATGHSARDIFELLHRKKIKIEFKPFALGVRIEHPQAFVDEMQYNQPKREAGLPAASYKLVSQVNNRGVYSFCMCPGGLVVPAATSPGEIVVNGMSLSKRDSPYANSGVVVELQWEDLKDFHKDGIFAGLNFQKHIEQQVFESGDQSQKAPAQRLTDIIEHRISSDLPSSSYIPGLRSHPVLDLFPDFIAQRLRQAILDFNKKMKGYLSHEAVAIATESRTSSPIRIPRDRKSYQHIEVENLFPCGEGAGYAGGIISAALDGQNVAQAIHQHING